jgi:hypothetical protein
MTNPVDKTRKVQVLTRDKLGGENVDSFEIDTNRVLPSQYFTDFAERLVFPTPSTQGFISRTLMLFGVGSLLGNVALSGGVGFLIVGVSSVPFFILNRFISQYRSDLRPAMRFFLVPLIVGLVYGAGIPSTNYQILPKIDRVIENAK